MIYKVSHYWVANDSTPTIDDVKEAIETAKDLARLEGIMCGISSGTNVAAAKKLAKKLAIHMTELLEDYFSQV